MNCSERKKPPISSSAIITATGVSAVNVAQTARKPALMTALHDQDGAEAEAAQDASPPPSS